METSQEKFIPVELAVGWTDKTWSDGHYVYVPENVGEIEKAAVTALDTEYNKLGIECAFIVVYNINWDEPCKEDGSPLNED